jgi:hypothetical protein
MSHNNIFEGIEIGDLARLINPVMSVDEFRSKMGEDKDIIVAGFVVMSKLPALDLVNFLEKSYDWVLDADVSSGETANGNYYVFVEMQRNANAIKNIMQMLEDMMNLTEQKLEDWTFTYINDPKEVPVTLENLQAKIITDPSMYEAKTSDAVTEAALFNNLRALAGVQTKPLGIVNPQILSIQRAAGIK